MHPIGFSHLDVMLVECYDPKGDQWNILQTPILEGRSGPGCAVLDDSIYLVGGYSWSMVRIILSENGCCNHQWTVRHNHPIQEKQAFKQIYVKNEIWKVSG